MLWVGSARVRLSGAAVLLHLVKEGLALPTPVVHHGALPLLVGVELVLWMVVGGRLRQVLSVVLLLLLLMGERQVVMLEVRVGRAVLHQASHPYLHPKLELLQGEGPGGHLLLLKPGLNVAHEGPGVGGSTEPRQAGHALVALGRQVGSGGLSLEQP